MADFQRREMISKIKRRVLFAGTLAGLLAIAEQTNADSGLIVTYKSGAATDTAVASNVCLFIREGKAATPFLASGKFTASWDGSINAELRGDFAFQAELNGNLKIEINGKPVYEASAAGTAPFGKFVQLNKGANAF